MNFYPHFMVIHPLSSICIEQYILKFDLVNNFSVDYVGFTYKLGQHFFIYRLEKFTLYKGSYFCWCNFSIKLSFLQRREKKRNTTLYDRYYLQTCKAVTFEKITNHAKINNLISQVNFIFSAWILIKQIVLSSTLSAVGGNRFSNKKCFPG